MTKGKTRKILGLSFMAVFVLACAIGLGACANKHEVKNISISDKTLDLTVGEETELTVDVTMKDDTEYDGMYYWSATQDGIVEINGADTWRTSDATVTVKAVAEGETTVYVEAGGNKTHCVITVGPAPEKPIVTDVKLSETSLTLEAGGDGKELSAVVTMSDGSEYDGEYVWSAAPEGYVSISGTGDTVTVTGEKAGNVLITFNAGGKEAACAVTVKPAYEESGYSEEIYVDFSDSDTYSWMETTSAEYTKTSDGTTTTTPYDNVIKSESEADTSPEGLLTIVGTNSPTSNEPMRIEDGHLVTAGKTQSAGRYLKLNLEDYEGAYLSVTVTFSAGKDDTAGRCLILGTDKTATDADGALYSAVSYKNDEVTTFEYSGVVTDTVLYLTFSANVWIYTVDVKVTGEDTSEPEVLAVNITPDTVELVLSDGASVTSQLVANVTMTKGDYAGGYAWVSDDESVAAVEGDGAFATVTAKSAGSAVITVTLDGGESATCTVTVSEPSHEHNYVVSGTPEWSYDYLTCIVTLVCQSDDGLTCDAPSITVDASVSVATVAATCTEYGRKTYTATYQGIVVATYTDEAALAPTGHSYGSPKWTWTAEGSGYSATASFTCTSCGDVQTVNAAVTESGGTYTATVTFENQSYSSSFNPETDTGEIVLSASYVSFSETGATFELEVLLSDLQSNYPGDVTWSSGDESVVKVDDTGIITSVGNGTAVVSATTGAGLAACCFVEVDIKVKGEDADIKIDDLVTSGTLSSGESISSTKNLYTGGDGTTVTAVGGDSMKVTDGTGEYTYTLNLGGNGKQDSRNVTIETVGAATITVYTKSSSGTDDRTLAFYTLETETDDDGKVTEKFTMLDSETAPAGGVAKVTFDAGEAGTYYLLSTDKGIYIYEIEISYSAVCDHAYGPWTVTSVPTATKTGKATRTCLNCGETKSLNLPKLTNSAYKAEDCGDGTSTYRYVYEGVTISFTAETLSDDFEEIDPEQLFTVTFETNQATVPTIYRDVYIYGTVTAPVLPGVTGQYFVGWYSDAALTEAYDFDTPVTSDMTLFAKYTTLDSGITYVAGIYESMAVEWSDTTWSGVKIYYKIATEDTYTTFSDSEAVREIGSGTYRVDILGLQGDTYYNVKIIDSANTQLAEYGVYVAGYDRSGYAHYEYDTESDTYGMYEAGVGAYTNEGTLKDGALVIYVTEENKNDVTGDVYKYDAATDTYIKVSYDELKPYLTMTVEDNKTAYAHEGDDPYVVTGIGEILNNRRYSGTDRRDVGIAALSKAYGAVAVRIVGEVTATINEDKKTYDIVGLTDYDATTNGGSVGDNGSMARMVNAQSVTIEGVGEDAAVTGWGFHFISSATYAESGKTGVGFEVRNLTFSKYCEDAVGMEGEQASKSTASDLSASVERCWVHNNTFLAGECEFAAESDKKEGDGSCDFKRGQYFTLSYNTFDSCHKTNLIGSASTSLQYNITMHHNSWFNCQSRIPLVRNANVHFYNNYVYGDGEVSLSYVHSARANSYIFAENNYYENCKNPGQTTSEGGGAIKAYGNTYLSCYGDAEATEVESRTETVKNNCQFSARKIDYSTFDTDSTLFYYDEDNERSDCYLTDAVTARQEVMQSAGAYSRDKALVDTNMSEYKDKVAGDSVNAHIGSDTKTLEIDLSSVTSADMLVNGVYFTAKASSGAVKGKGQVVTFRLTETTDVYIETAGTTEKDWGELVSSDGRVYASHFASVSVTLPAGTYFITCSTPNKEVTITKLTFSFGLTDDERVRAVIDLIDEIGDVQLTSSSYEKIQAALSAYEALSSDLKEKVTNYATLQEAAETYSALEIENVETLIGAIGTVGESSGSAISAAREAYDGLSDEQKAKVANYETLTAAETAYANIAVEVVNQAISALESVDDLTGKTEDELKALLSAYEDVTVLYEALTDEQKTQITGYDKVTSGIEKINEQLNLVAFVALLDAVTDVGTISSDEAAAVIDAYNALTEAQQSGLSQEQMSKYEEIVTVYNESMQGVTVIIFANPSKNTESDPGNPVLAGNRSDVVINNASYNSSQNVVYESDTYQEALKIDSSVVVTITVPSGIDLDITISTANVTSLYVAVGSGSKQEYTPADDLITLHINADENTGTIEISLKSKGSGNAFLLYVIIDSTGTSAMSLPYMGAVLPETGKE